MLNGIGSKIYDASAFVLNPIKDQLKATPKTLFVAAAALSLYKGYSAYKAQGADATYRANFTAATIATGKWAAITTAAATALHFIWTALASHPTVRLGGAILGGAAAIVTYAHKNDYLHLPKWGKKADADPA